jgi:hypothetical protein
MIPLTEARYKWLIKVAFIDNVVVLDDGVNCEVIFDATAFASRANSTNPFIPDSDELKKVSCNTLQSTIKNYLNAR